MMWQFNIWHLSKCATNQKCSVEVPENLFCTYNSVIFLFAKYLVKNNSSISFSQRCSSAVIYTGGNLEKLS